METSFKNKTNKQVMLREEWNRTMTLSRIRLRASCSYYQSLLYRSPEVNNYKELFQYLWQRWPCSSFVLCSTSPPWSRTKRTKLGATLGIKGNVETIVFEKLSITVWNVLAIHLVTAASRQSSVSKVNLEFVAVWFELYCSISSIS